MFVYFVDLDLYYFIGINYIYDYKNCLEFCEFFKWIIEFEGSFRDFDMEVDVYNKGIKELGFRRVEIRAGGGFVW